MIEQQYDEDGRPVMGGVPDLPGVVVAALFRKIPDMQLSWLHWDTIMQCWTFQRFGMLIGVERDGYIHT